MRYSQNNEQDIISEYFKDRKGSFLDIGAYDGLTFSNTKYLHEHGWKGIFIEPSPANFVGLIKNIPEDNSILVNAAVSFNRGLIKFYDSNGDAISTTDSKHKDKWSTYTKFRELYVNTITLDEIIQNFGKAYELINIDVEGASVELFGEIANRFEFTMICVEHDNKISECDKIANKLGLKKLLINAENLIYAR